MATGSFGSALRSFWHTMTSNDRHASHNSPYRTGQHVPLPQSRHAALNLTSVATDAAESRTDLSATNPSLQELGKQSASSTVYSPGMRSLQRKQSSDDNARGEIQMQNFTEGLPPAPPVSHSWKRIEGWVESNYEELYDQLGEGCSQNDINELEHELDCTLPMEVRESLQVHDGQERGGLPTGIIFGCMLLDCEEIVQEWKNWRRVSQDFLRRQPTITIESPQVPSKAFGGPSSSKEPPPPAADTPQPNSMWREDLLAKQDSQPPNAIQKAYTHISWIPLARDWGGNCLAVDLAPGPAGKWGQVIIMGRDYDCKYVVARSWAAFLANVADDIGTPKVFVHEESGELKLREFKQQGVEPSYLNIIRWRVDQKYGRKGPRRRPMNGDMKANSNVAGSMGRGSPYGSPNDDRGRSPQRFQQRNGLTGSPRATISSPLARVAEEPLAAAVSIHSGASSPRKNSLANESLLKLDSRRDSELLLPSPLSENQPLTAAVEEPSKENRRPAGTGLGVKGLEINGVDDADGMKEVQL